MFLNKGVKLDIFGLTEETEKLSFIIDLFIFYPGMENEPERCPASLLLPASLTSQFDACTPQRKEKPKCIYLTRLRISLLSLALFFLLTVFSHVGSVRTCN